MLFRSLGSFSDIAKGAFPMLGCVGVFAGVVVVQFSLECSVDEDGKLSGRGGDGLGLTDTVGDAAIVGAQGRGGAAKDHGGHAQQVRGSVRRGLRPELINRLPEILFLGARVNHDVKCL